MAELYWRVKNNGKWKWVRVVTSCQSMDDIRTGTRHEPNTVGYGFLSCYKYRPGNTGALPCECRKCVIGEGEDHE